MARANHKSGMGWLKRWFVHKYQLPPNHPLFVNRSRADLILELYEDMHADRDAIRQKIADVEKLPSDQGSEAREMYYEQLNRLNEALGDPREESDPLIAKWEAQLAAGIVPDLKDRSHG